MAAEYLDSKKEEEFLALYRSGRFQKTPAFTLAVVGALPDQQAEAFIYTRSESLLGVCWISALERVLAVAHEELDTEKTNPTLSVVRRAFDEMRGSASVADAIVTRATERKIIRFPAPDTKREAF